MNMQYEDWLILYMKALDWAEIYHKGQKDLGGHPYMGHVVRVSDKCSSIQAMIVGLMHDLLEDTHIRVEDLQESGFPDEIINALICLCHVPGVPYDEYIENVSLNELAREVKIHDLEDNMNITRLPNLEGRDVKRLKKYLKAWQYLTKYNKQ